MSKKNETIILFLTLILTGLLVALGWWAFQNVIKPQTSTLPSDVKLSFGEQSILSTEGNNNARFQSLKTNGIQAINNKKHPDAVSLFQTAINQNINAPETLIYLNNARIGQQKAYIIVVVTPASSNSAGASEILRGVAQAQTEINTAKGINGVPLRVGIADDGDKEENAIKIAQNLVNNQDVVGVVGHFASQATLAAAPIYNSGKLVAISPISSAVELTKKQSPYVFRTVPSDYVAARSLADYMLGKLQRRQAAVFFNSESAYSQSLKSEFSTAIPLGGGQIVGEFDMSKSDFSAAQSIKVATDQGAEVLMLASNTSTLDKALQVVQANEKKLPLLGGDDVYNFKTLEVGKQAADGMVVAVPWHIDADPKSTFVRDARQLWGGADVNWRTATAYDATRALITALQQNPSRAGVQQALSSNNFTAVGAAGTIRFLPSGDRNTSVQLVKVVPSPGTDTGYRFVPLQQSAINN